MSSTTKTAHILSTLTCIMAAALCSCTSGQLSSDFYSTTCPNVQTIVANATQAAIMNEPRIAASLTRLHFHDCFVNGCDASILLDDTTNATGEKTAIPNNNSVRGFDVIDTIKAQVESACPSVVSCADILTLAARDSVVAAGGPTWTVLLGRRDSLTANLSGANSDLPAPTANLTTLISMFRMKGLSAQDMTALSGAHTIGFARCTTFRTRIYSDTNINATFAATLQANCPSTSGSGDDNLAALDVQTSAAFDTAYFQNLLTQQGLLHSDQELFNNGTQDTLATTYSSDRSTFFTDFAMAMVNMGNISPLTGTDGEIRCNCRVVNS